MMMHFGFKPLWLRRNTSCTLASPLLLFLYSTPSHKDLERRKKKLRTREWHTRANAKFILIKVTVTLTVSTTVEQLFAQNLAHRGVHIIVLSPDPFWYRSYGLPPPTIFFLLNNAIYLLHLLYDYFALVSWQAKTADLMQLCSLMTMYVSVVLDFSIQEEMKQEEREREKSVHWPRSWSQPHSYPLCWWHLQREKVFVLNVSSSLHDISNVSLDALPSAAQVPKTQERSQTVPVV